MNNAVRKQFTATLYENDQFIDEVQLDVNNMEVAKQMFFVDLEYTPQDETSGIIQRVEIEEEDEHVG